MSLTCLILLPFLALESLDKIGMLTLLSYDDISFSYHKTIFTHLKLKTYHREKGKKISLLTFHHPPLFIFCINIFIYIYHTKLGFCGISFSFFPISSEAMNCTELK